MKDGLVAKRRKTSGEGEGRREVKLSPKLSPSWPKENVVENRSQGRKREEVPRKVIPPKKGNSNGKEGGRSKGGCQGNNTCEGEGG